MEHSAGDIDYHNGFRSEQSRISRTPYLQLEGARCHRGSKFSCHSGPKFSPVTTYAPKKASTPQMDYEALEISEVGGPFERKVYITVTLGPFESKVFTHCNCYWRPLWNKSRLRIHYSCCWALLKARYFAHYGSYWGPLWKPSEPTYTLELSLWAPLKA